MSFLSQIHDVHIIVTPCSYFQLCAVAHDCSTKYGNYTYVDIAWYILSHMINRCTLWFQCTKKTVYTACGNFHGPCQPHSTGVGGLLEQEVYISKLNAASLSVHTTSTSINWASHEISGLIHPEWLANSIYTLLYVYMHTCIRAYIV